MTKDVEKQVGISVNNQEFGQRFEIFSFTNLKGTTRRGVVLKCRKAILTQFREICKGLAKLFSAHELFLANPRLVKARTVSSRSYLVAKRIATA